jgi:hypothetical protein
MPEMCGEFLPVANEQENIYAPRLRQRGGIMGNGSRSRRLLAQLVVFITSALITSTALMSVQSASALDAPAVQARSAVAKRQVLASEIIGPGGGAVRAKNGVAIRVPRGVMSFTGRVEVVRLARETYDFHIYARWNGKVEIRLPKLNGQNVIMHQVGENQWVEEAAKSDGKHFAVAKVASLSTFTNLIGCFKHLKPSPGAAVSVVKCLVGLGIKKLPETLAKKLVGVFNDYNGCEPFSPSNWTVDWIDVHLSHVLASL